MTGFPISYGDDKTDGLTEAHLIKFIKIISLILPVLVLMPRFSFADSITASPISTKNKIELVACFGLAENSLFTRTLQHQASVSPTKVTAAIVVTYFVSLVVRVGWKYL